MGLLLCPTRMWETVSLVETASCGSGVNYIFHYHLLRPTVGAVEVILHYLDIFTFHTVVVLKASDDCWTSCMRLDGIFLRNRDHTVPDNSQTQLSTQMKQDAELFIELARKELARAKEDLQEKAPDEADVGSVGAIGSILGEPIATN